MTKTLVTVYQPEEVKSSERRVHSGQVFEELDMRGYEVVYGERNVEGLTLFCTADGRQDHGNLLIKLVEVTNSEYVGDVDALARAGYKGRAISKGDIVRINSDYYYFAILGWTPIQPKNVPHM